MFNERKMAVYNKMKDCYKILTIINEKLLQMINYATIFN